VRDTNGNMRKITFTSENPAYFLAMWRIDPNAVLGLYRDYIDPNVQLQDLYLRYTADCKTGKAGDPVIDPTTGLPAYDTVNKWNAGTACTPGQFGGAMHLTSGPNTLSAEVYLAAAATIMRPTEKQPERPGADLLRAIWAELSQLRPAYRLCSQRGDK
jgi:hypothetical protein